MNDGDIDYSGYTANELREALAGIRRDMYPKNHANIVAALGALNGSVEAPPAPEPEIREPGALAPRGVRLGAVLIDSLISIPILLPAAFASGFWQTAMSAAAKGEQVPSGMLIAWMAFSVVVFVLIQGYPLVTDGQTWGKKAVSIKIVDMQGVTPSIARLSARYAVVLLVGSIPLIGKLASLIDILLIFRRDKRCGHDLLAGTRVVNAAARA